MNKPRNIIIKATEHFEIVLRRDSHLMYHVEDNMNPDMIQITSYDNFNSANEHYKNLRKHYRLNKPTGRNAQRVATTNMKVVVVFANKIY